MDSDAAHMIAASKVPMLKLGEFELWRMRIEQYIQMMDYALWDIIKNGNSILKMQTVNNVKTVIPPTTAEEKLQKRNEVKERSILMTRLPNEHQLKFNLFKDAKTLPAAIEKRFGGNDSTKKTQRNLLKQQYENFSESSFESLDQTFDKLQKLVSQLELLSEVISQEDINKKFLRSLPSEWNITNTQNMAFVSSSSNNSNSSNGVNTAQRVNTTNGVNTASSQVNAAGSLNIDNLSDVVICSFLASQPNSTHLVNEDLEHIHVDDLEEMDLKKTVLVETPNSSALVSCDGLGGYDWSDQAEEGLTNYALMAYSTPSASSSDSEVSDCSKSCLKAVENQCQIVDNYKKGLGYNVVPPPHTGLFLPPKSNLYSIGLEELFSEPKTKKSKNKANEVEHEFVLKHSDAPIIEDWVLDDEEEEVKKTEAKPSVNRINFV
uniref:Ribonuclease H-like domain-containing protein n=1 Tax=Tanacetum cinerariifolium TaxID=118510 RepID=A0A6L2NB21_TANCI|nr:ribonuclease H-like domain-containing protein [Tanacetum cinerariifolium]